jgi:hypothetical protein
MASDHAATLSGRRVASLGALSAVLHAAFDAACTLVGATPPYLRLDDAPEVFRFMSPVAVSTATSIVSGVIAAIAVVVVAEAGHRRRPLVLGAVVGAFWMFSAALSRVVWFDTPLLPSIAAIACGVPRGLAIGWALARLTPQRGSGGAAVTAAASSCDSPASPPPL